MNPVLITIGSFELRWYSILIFIAVALGFILAIVEAKKYKISGEYMFNMLFWVVIAGLIGARLYYVIFNWEQYSGDLLSILRFWEGGLAIHGGILGGFIALVLYCKKYDVRIFKMTDIICVPLILGQAIGRWGNFFNGEAHGVATTLAHLQELHIPNFIINGMEIGGIYYQPTFLYESLWCIIGFMMLLIVRKFKYIKVGQLTSLYFMWYSVGRFFIEAMRTDSLMLGGFRVAQIVSIALFTISLIAFMILSRQGRFENLYHQEETKEIRF